MPTLRWPWVNEGGRTSRRETRVTIYAPACVNSRRTSPRIRRRRPRRRAHRMTEDETGQRHTPSPIRGIMSTSFRSAFDSRLGRALACAKWRERTGVWPWGVLESTGGGRPERIRTEKISPGVFEGRSFVSALYRPWGPRPVGPASLRSLPEAKAGGDGEPQPAGPPFPRGVSS